MCVCFPIRYRGGYYFYGAYQELTKLLDHAPELAFIR